MRCPSCERKCSIVDVFECKLCGIEFCLMCRLPETHACKGLEDKIRRDREALAKNLPKCIPKKI